MARQLTQIWVGIDAGKTHHWMTAVDEVGAAVWNQKVPNDETTILDAIGTILALADQVHWAIDITGTASALLLALLAAHGQEAVYVPGRTVNRMSGAYPGEAKTDARDAYVIAETTRVRRDFTTIGISAQLAAGLALLTARRSDLITDRVRMVNRLGDVLTGIFPAPGSRLRLRRPQRRPHPAHRLPDTNSHPPPRPQPPHDMADPPQSRNRRSPRTRSCRRPAHHAARPAGRRGHRGRHRPADPRPR